MVHHLMCISVCVPTDVQLEEGHPVCSKYILNISRIDIVLILDL